MQGCFADFQTGAVLPCWPVPDSEWATAFMHELGHNLGLYHGGYGRPANGGGFFTDNYKRNYVSVMNYAYSTQEPIIASSTATASRYWYRVDYSDETLAPLDEHNLDETAGIGPTLHPTDYIEWISSVPEPGFELASGPLDWNLNGSPTDTGFSADLDSSPFSKASTTGPKSTSISRTRIGTRSITTRLSVAANPNPERLR
jgi:hypothetical protein